MPTATTQRSVRARSKAKPHFAYPEHQVGCSGTDPKFMLACWLREQAQREALKELVHSKSFDKKSEPLRYGVYAGMLALEEAAKISLKYVVRDGMLPFAHAHTTYFEQVAA